MSLWDWLGRTGGGAEAERIALRRRALQVLTLGSAGALVALAALAGAAVAEARGDGPEGKEKEKEEEKEGKGEGKEGKEAKEAGEAKKKVQHRWGMAIDLDKCTGCGGCVVACQQENNVVMLTPEQAERTRGNFWMDLLHTTEGKYPDISAQLLPVPCMHCDNPPCVKVCPVGATYKGEDGIVAQVWDRCIGCRYCEAACPYSRRYYNWAEPEWDEMEAEALNPDVGCRPEGVVEKCVFCHHRIRALREQARADERELTDADYRHLTACSQSCPAKAITFGDLNDPHSEVSRLHASPRAIRLLDELGTNPKVAYLRETKWRE